MTRRILGTVTVVATLALGLAGCATGGTSTSDSGAKIIHKGQLSVCTSLPFKPFEFRKGKSIVGFDMDMIQQIAQKLDLKRNIVVTPFEGIQSGQSLNTSKCDIAAAGMTITDERAKAIDFTDPYFDATQALLVKKGSGYSSLDDLAGKTIGVQQGTTGQIYVNKHKPQGATVRVFEDLGLLTTAVKTGQVDAGVQDNGPLLDFVNRNPDTQVTTEFNTGEHYGFAVKKDSNPKLLKAANETIKKVKSDGTYDKLYKKWFGKAAPSS